MLTTIGLTHSHQLGIVVRAVRIGAGLSQADAAALCGVSGPFLSGLERGKPTAQIGLVLQVCQGLGISLSARVPQAIPALADVPHRRRARRGPR